MAVFTAYGRFGPNNFDLNYMLNRTSDTHFANNANDVYDSVTYRDSFGYNWFGPKKALTTTVAGPKLIVDNSGAMPELTGGTMTGLFEFTYKNASPVLRFSLQDFTASAATFAAASQTAGQADDRSFFADIFSGRDTVNLSQFNDEFRGYGGNDRIKGRLGDDRLQGDKGGDRLEGGGGNDVLLGNNGTDTLLGATGKDLIRGGVGGDTLNGGRGADRLFAGEDNAVDTFVYKSASDSHAGNVTHDRICQFDSGEDVIDLSGVDANTNVGGNQAFVVSVPGPAANSVWLAAVNQVIFVRADVNGDGVQDFELEMVGLLAMHTNDLIL